MRLNGGPLSYRSVRTPQPLSLEEEAALAFAGCGITGPVLPTCPTTAAMCTRPAEATSWSTSSAARLRAATRSTLSLFSSSTTRGLGCSSGPKTILAPRSPSLLELAEVTNSCGFTRGPYYSDSAIAATIAYCDYVYERYGRFPANSGPFRTVLSRIRLTIWTRTSTIGSTGKVR